MSSFYLMTICRLFVQLLRTRLSGDSITIFFLFSVFKLYFESEKIVSYFWPTGHFVSLKKTEMIQTFVFRNRASIILCKYICSLWIIVLILCSFVFFFLVFTDESSKMSLQKHVYSGKDLLVFCQSNYE